MKKTIGALLAAVAVTAGLAACNGNSSNSIPGGGTNCGSPPNSLEVLYPKPNARKIPPNVGFVWVATNGKLAAGNQYDFLSVQSNGVQQYTVNQSGQPGFFSVGAGSIPSPHATPSFSNPTYYATAFQFPIGPQQTVNLYWNDAGTGCRANVVVSSFST